MKLQVVHLLSQMHSSFENIPNLAEEEHYKILWDKMVFDEATLDRCRQKLAAFKAKEAAEEAAAQSGASVPPAVLDVPPDTPPH